MIGPSINAGQRLAGVLESVATRIPPATMAIVADTVTETTERLATMAMDTGQPAIGRMLRVHAAMMATGTGQLATGHGDPAVAWDSTPAIAAAFRYASAATLASRDPATSFHEVAALCAVHARVLTAMDRCTDRATLSGQWSGAEQPAQALHSAVEAFGQAVREVEQAVPSALLRPSGIRLRPTAPSPGPRSTDPEPGGPSWA